MVVVKEPFDQLPSTQDVVDEENKLSFSVEKYLGSCVSSSHAPQGNKEGILGDE